MVSLRSNPDSVVTSAAYLLVYRRRSPHPLGPPELQELYEEHWNPKSIANSEPSSRTDSPAGSQSGSGKGQRALDDLSRNGLSSALEDSHSLEAVAEAPRRRAGAGSDGTRARTAATTVEDDEDELDLPPPAYEEDEGIALNDDVEAGGAIIGPLPQSAYDGAEAGPPYGQFTGYAQSYGAGWTFNHYDAARDGETGGGSSAYEGDADADMDDDDDNAGGDLDNDSNIAADGENDIDDDFEGRGRLLEDFGDELADLGHGADHPPSPALRLLAPDLEGASSPPSAVHDVMAEMEAAGGPVGEAEMEDEPVAEVRVDAEAGPSAGELAEK